MGHDDTVKVWATSTGSCLHTLEGHRFSVSSVCMSPDGSQIISGSWDDTVRVCRHDPVEASHTFTVSSCDPEMICDPSALIQTEVTSLPWPSRVCRHDPV